MCNENMTAPAPWAPTDEDIEVIASICHEANRALCVTQGDLSQVPWSDAPDWQKDSARNGVRLHINNPRADGRESHDCWMEEKLRAGWRYGETKDVENKTHPCLLPYNALPPEQKIKDDIFLAIVRGYLGGMDRNRIKALG